MVVVKANGYGHGAVAVARAAVEGGAAWLGVADLAEALELRDARHRRHRCSPGCTSRSRFAARARSAHRHRGELPRPARVGRPGTAGARRGSGLRAAQARHRARPQRCRRAEVGGALRRGRVARDRRAPARARHLQPPRERRRRGGCAAARAASPGHRGGAARGTRAASCGTWRRRRPLFACRPTRLDLVRLGIGAYGLSPFDDGGPAELRAAAAMTLRSTVVAVAPSSDARFRRALGHRAPRLRRRDTPAGRRPHPCHRRRRLAARDPNRIRSPRRRTRVAGRRRGARRCRDALRRPLRRAHRPPTSGPEAADTINYEIVTRLGGRVAREYAS